MSVSDSLLIRAARRETVERTPVWFMRQAGRVLPEYRAIRKDLTLMEIARRPELCAEVTLQPVQRFGVDAAILFADIMHPLVGVGVDLEIVDAVGPVIRRPVRSGSEVNALRPLTAEIDLPFVLDTIRILKKELGGKIPLIGFAGAPFTLASYLIEGKASRDFVKTKTMMHSAPELWHDLMDRLTDIVISYLMAQRSAGADVLQLFDSWVGCLSPTDYATNVEPYCKRIFEALNASDTPLIHFGVNTATLLSLMKDDGAGVIGVDWRIPLDDAWDIIGHDKAIQGNLDPAILCCSAEAIEREVRDVLRRAGGRPGHIFNLGHGLLPDIPVDAVQRVVDLVHEVSTVGTADGSLGAGARR